MCDLAVQRLNATNLSTGLGDRTEVVDHVGLGHTNTRINDSENLVLLVGDDTDVEVLASVEDRRVGEGRVADLVEGIGGVRDDFPEEDLLVRVECVYAYAFNTTRIA